MSPLLRTDSLPPDAALVSGWQPFDFGGKDHPKSVTKPQSTLFSVMMPLGPADEEKGRSCRSMPNNVLPIVSIQPVPSSDEGDGGSETEGDDEFDDLFFAAERKEDKVDFFQTMTQQESLKLQQEKQLDRFKTLLFKEVDKVFAFDGAGRQSTIVQLSDTPVTTLPVELAQLQHARKHSPPILSNSKPAAVVAPTSAPASSAEPQPAQAATPALRPLPAIQRAARTFGRSQTTPVASSSSFLSSPSSDSSTPTPAAPARRVHSRSTSGTLNLPHHQPTSTDGEPSSSDSENPSRSTKRDFISFEKLPIELFLSRCNLTTSSLTWPLFAITNLTVLSLRHNNLTSLPPSFSRLINLQELNLSNNQLEYLPSEILNLGKLKKIVVASNPWKRIPTSEKELEETTNGRVLGKKIIIFEIPSLLEICTRFLLAKDPDSSSSTSRRISSEELPYFGLPEHLLIPFRSTLLPSQNVPSACDPESNVCQSPLHSHGGEKTYFKHAVERFEWATLKSLQPNAEVREAEGVGTKKGMEERIPILWRGCGVKCLDWLEQ